MLRKKAIASLMALTMALTMTSSVAVFASEEANDFGGVTITMMNSKPEIQEALEEITAAWGEANNCTFEVYETDDPSGTLTQKYASGDAPVIAIVSDSQIVEMAEEKFMDLGGEAWTADGGEALGYKVNDVLYGFPLCVEAGGIVYNKTAIEEVIGREFVAADYASLDAFTGLLEELRAGGMENPFVLNQEDYSLAGHFLRNSLYHYQGEGDAAGVYKMIEDIKAGTSIAENPTYQSVAKAYELFLEYNINKDDPLAADYDLNASYVTEGEAAFWIGGSWVWPDMEEYVVDGMEYGMMPAPSSVENLAGHLYTFASKFMVLDKESATEEQIAAAKAFMNWLVYTDEGKDAMVNKCSFVVAFTNNSLPSSNPLNNTLKAYVDAGLTVNAAPFACPSAHTAEIAPHMQAIMAGTETIDDLTAALDTFWAAQ